MDTDGLFWFWSLFLEDIGHLLEFHAPLTPVLLNQ